MFGGRSTVSGGYTILMGGALEAHGMALPPGKLLHWGQSGAFIVPIAGCNPAPDEPPDELPPLDAPPSLHPPRQMVGGGPASFPQAFEEVPHAQRLIAAHDRTSAAISPPHTLKPRLFVTVMEPSVRLQPPIPPMSRGTTLPDQKNGPAPSLTLPLP